MLATPSAFGFSLGVGLLNPYDKTQDNSGQDQVDPISPTISVSHSWMVYGSTSFAPILGCTRYTNTTTDSYGGNYTVDGVYLLYDFLTPLTTSGDLSFRYGIRSMRKQVSGDGGQVTIPNGNSTAVVFKPSLSKWSSTTSLNVGLDFRFGSAGFTGTDQGLRLELFVMDPIDKMKRMLALSLNYALASTDAVVNLAAQSCPNVGVTNEMLREAIRISVEDFWNTVSESKLRLKVGEVVNRTTYAELIPGEILVGCNTTSPMGGNGGFAQADVAKGSSFIQLDSQIMAAGFDRIVGVVVHEMGHSVGLSHSADPASVMTYAAHGWGLRPSDLSQNDKNGVAYLYPIDGSSYGFVPGCTSQAAGIEKPRSETLAIIAFLQELCFFMFVLMIVKIQCKFVHVKPFRKSA